MTDQQLPEQFSDPEKYRIIKGGAIQEVSSGKIVGHSGGEYQFTPERARELMARRLEASDREEMRVLAERGGVEDPDKATEEELIQAEARARGKFVGHAFDLAMDAKSPRAIEGLFPKLARPGGGSADRPVTANFIQNNYTDMEQARALADVWRDVIQLQEQQAREQGEIVDAHWTAHEETQEGEEQ